MSCACVGIVLFPALHSHHYIRTHVTKAAPAVTSYMLYQHTHVIIMSHLYNTMTSYVSYQHTHVVYYVTPV